MLLSSASNLMAAATAALSALEWGEMTLAARAEVNAFAVPVSAPRFAAAVCLPTWVPIDDGKQPRRPSPTLQIYYGDGRAQPGKHDFPLWWGNGPPYYVPTCNAVPGTSGRGYAKQESMTYIQCRPTGAMCRHAAASMVSSHSRGA
ncbi:hypothetical protein FDECE_16974 [Fusarium decemcellulare]|nr:hypothetical protein FDECE_16974 [Fusarium decemcellulare]